MATKTEFKSVVAGDKIEVPGYEDPFIVTRIEDDDENTKIYMRQARWPADTETLVALSQADGVKVIKTRAAEEAAKNKTKTKDEERAESDQPPAAVPTTEKGTQPPVGKGTK